MKHETEFEKNEAPVAAESLLEEILPLMEEYFIGEVSIVNKELIYSIPNGQRFKITATASN